MSSYEIFFCVKTFLHQIFLICRFCTDELATDVTGAEALLEQHQEHRTEIDARSGTFQAFELFSQQLVEADIIAHEDRINGMNELENSGQFDSIDIRNKKENISMRYKHIQDLAAHRQALLNEANTLHQFFRDIADEESWIKEKKLLVTSDDYGRDLTRVQNLRKKHKRIESEEDQVKYFSFSSGNFLHRNVFHKIFSIQVLEAGAHLIASSTLGGAETEQRLQQLTAVWQELKGMELEESIIYQ